MNVLTPGTKVRYLGELATVIHGNEPDPEWGRNEPSGTINIRFDRDVSRRMSQQQDVYVIACLPA